MIFGTFVVFAFVLALILLIATTSGVTSGESVFPNGNIRHEIDPFDSPKASFWSKSSRTGIRHANDQGAGGNKREEKLYLTYVDKCHELAQYANDMEAGLNEIINDLMDLLEDAGGEFERREAETDEEDECK